MAKGLVDSSSSVACLLSLLLRWAKGKVRLREVPGSQELYGEDSSLYALSENKQEDLMLLPKKEVWFSVLVSFE